MVRPFVLEADAVTFPLPCHFLRWAAGLLEDEHICHIPFAMSRESFLTETSKRGYPRSQRVRTLSPIRCLPEHTHVCYLCWCKP